MEEAGMDVKAPSPPVPPSFATGFTIALRVCGVIILLMGLFFAVLFWDDARRFSGPYGRYYLFALSATLLGVLFFALLNVIAEMAEGLRAIRYELSRRR